MLLGRAGMCPGKQHQPSVQLLAAGWVLFRPGDEIVQNKVPEPGERWSAVEPFRMPVPYPRPTAAGFQGWKPIGVSDPSPPTLASTPCPGRFC